MDNRESIRDGMNIDTNTDSSKQTILQAGVEAPDFTLHATPTQSLSLDEFSGRPIVLAFYPADWSPICGNQMSLYNEVLPLLEPYDAQLIGISVDNAWCHDSFSDAQELDFPLLADFEPKGAVAKKYGVYREDDGTSERALFVIDGDGIIIWSYLSPIGINPGANGFLAALESLSADSNSETVSP